MRRLTTGLIALACITLSSCGFTLRTESLAQQISHIDLPNALERNTRIAIERHAMSHGISLGDGTAHSERAINGISTTENERVTRVDPLGRPIEYLLSVRWDVSFKSDPQVPLVLHASESVGLNETSLIGFEKEKRRIYDVLREELATRLFERLALLPTADSSN